MFRFLRMQQSRGYRLSSLLASALATECPAYAQSLPSPTHQQSAPAPPSASQPSAASQTYSYPKDCGASLPQEIQQPQVESATIFSYRLTLSGEMHDVTLLKSSGNADRDRAALQCAQQIHGKPMTIAGNPAEISWVEAYYWRVPPMHSGFGIPAPDGSENVCRYNYYPPVAIRLGQQGSVIVAYRIGTDGAVKDVAIKQSSGYPFLDGATVTCVEFFRYYPVTQNGKPVEVDDEARMNWVLQ